MSKEKVNGVKPTLFEKSEGGTWQLKDEVLEVLSEIKTPKNSQKYSKDTWRKLRAEFEAGTYLSQTALAKKYGVHLKTLTSRMVREKWNERQRALQSKVELVIEKKVLKELSEADSYLKASFKRAVRFEGIAEACIAQAGTNSEGIPLVEPDQLDAVTRSLVRLHELAKSSLRLPTVAMDITTNGQGLGESFVQAIAKLRSEGQPKLSGEDLSKVLEAEVE